MVHMKLVWAFISVTILSLLFLCKVVLFHPNEFWLELKLFLRNRFALTTTFILYLCELGYGFFQWHLATSLTKHLTFFFFLIDVWESLLWATRACIQNSMSSQLYSARLIQVNRGFRSERGEKSGQQEIWIDWLNQWEVLGKRQRIPIPFIINWKAEMFNSKEGQYYLRIGLNWQSTSKHSASNRMTDYVIGLATSAWSPCFFMGGLWI